MQVVDSRHEHGDDDFVAFLSTGMQAAGQYRCSGCGYGITLHGKLPICPMCSGESWEPTAWTPLSSSNDLRSLRRLSPPAAPL